MASPMDPDPHAFGDAELEAQRRALADTRERIAAMESLLEELPALFEARFRERLAPLLQQQQQLLSDNAALRQQLLQLQGSRPGRHLRALSSTVLPEPVPLNPDGGEPPTDASAGPTHR
jgi:hypothetical protein